MPARQANAVNVGQSVHFVADGRQFDGKVARVSPTIDPATRTVTVYVQIPNARGTLKGGTFATGRVVSRVISNTLVVPTSAIRQSAGEGRPFVYRIANRTIDVAPVQVGVVDDRGGTTQILDGLNAGDRVVVGNVGTLGRGMQVTSRAKSGKAAGREVTTTRAHSTQDQAPGTQPCFSPTSRSSAPSSRPC